MTVKEKTSSPQVRPHSPFSDRVRPGRRLPPAGAPLTPLDLLHGLGGLLRRRRYEKKLESEMRTVLGVRDLFFVSSGKAALTLILRALMSLSPRREVVIPAYTCFSVPSAVIRAKLDVVLCDVEPTTFDFKADLLDAAVTEKTLCVVCSHLFGIPSDLDRIRRFCRERGVFLVEDAAQAMGGTYRGRPLGTIGDVGFFSFGRGKNVTCGTGGAVVTDSPTIAEAIRALYFALESPGFLETLKDLMEAALTALFIRPSLYRFPSLIPFLKLGQTIFYKDFPLKKLSGMKMGLLARWRERLQEANRSRTESAAYFLKKIGAGEAVPASIPYLRLPIMMESREARDRLVAVAEERGWGLSTLYPTPINEIAEIRSVFAGKTYPSAKAISERLVTVPTHPWVGEADRKEIGDHLAALWSRPSVERAGLDVSVTTGEKRAEAG